MISRILTSVPKTLAPPPSALSPPANLVCQQQQQRRSSYHNRIPSPKPHIVATASGIRVPDYKSIHCITFPTFIEDLRRLNKSKEDLTQMEVQEALETAMRGVVGSKAMRKAKKTLNGRTAEGDTARFELERVRRESEAYWDRGKAERQAATAEERRTVAENGGGGSQDQR